jgi:endonuclease YncB( thermonuclease family)
VFLTGKSQLNAEMIERGYGHPDRQGSHPPRDEFIAIEDTARRNKLGVWAQ